LFRVLEEKNKFILRDCVIPTKLVIMQITLGRWKREIQDRLREADIEMLKMLFNLKSFLDSIDLPLVEQYAFPKEFETLYRFFTNEEKEFYYETENVKIKKIEPFIVEIEKDGRKERINVINCEDILKLKKLLNDEAIKELEEHTVLNNFFNLF
jgi:hypothetical protein